MVTNHLNFVQTLSLYMSGKACSQVTATIASILFTSYSDGNACLVYPYCETKNLDNSHFCFNQSHFQICQSHNPIVKNRSLRDLHQPKGFFYLCLIGISQAEGFLVLEYWFLDCENCN